MAVLRWSARALVVTVESWTFARAFSSTAPGTQHVNGARTKAGDWDADRYSTNAGFVPELGKSVLDLLSPVRGERILDIGCGHGVLTAELKARGCRVVGIDFAPDMVSAAVARDVEAYVMDASAIDAPFLLSKLAGGLAPPAPSFVNDGVDTPTATAPAFSGGEDRRELSTGEPPAYDAVFTNAALHWVRAPQTVIDGAKRVLRPGGRFVGEFGGHGNMAAVRVAMHAALWRRGLDPLKVDPWYFPTPDEYRRLLEQAGFIVDDIALVPRPTLLPPGTGMRGWLSTFTWAFLNALPNNPSEGTACELDENGMSKAQVEVLDEALAALQPALKDSDGIWTADYVRLRFRARLPTCKTKFPRDAVVDGQSAIGSGWRDTRAR